MARYYSKNYKNRITGKLNHYGGWQHITNDTTYKRKKRDVTLVCSPWGYWVAITNYNRKGHW